MPITKPILPPKAGYVEIVSADGLHIYKPTPETARKLAEAEANQAAGTSPLTLWPNTRSAFACWNSPPDKERRKQ